MISSLYIVVSVAVFFFDILPSYRHMKERPEYEKVVSRVRMDFADKIGLILGSVNLAVCAVLIVLKLFGILKWW